MLAQFETVRRADGSFTAYERVEREFPFCWHYHPEFELTLITDSEGQRMVGDAICNYRPGDLVLLGPNLQHSYRSWPAGPASCKLHRAIVIQFREDCFGDHFFELPEMVPILQMFQRSALGLSFGDTETERRVTKSLRTMPKLPPGKRFVSLISTLVELAADERAKPISTETLLLLCNPEVQRRINQICSYLQQHSDREIDFTELAHSMRMSHAALCRLFKHATGRTMTTYINQLRIGAATRLLANSDLSVLEIGFRVGFGNYSNFHRQFKSIKGVTPQSLRRAFYETREEVAV